MCVFALGHGFPKDDRVAGIASGINQNLSIQGTLGRAITSDANRRGRRRISSSDAVHAGPLFQPARVSIDQRGI